MADTTTTKLIIPGHGHVFVNAVDAAAFDFTKFVFGDSTTYKSTVLTDPDWVWIGDTSRDNTMEFSVDGGEATQLSTWDRDGVSTIYSPESITATISSVNADLETFQLAYPGGTVNVANKSYRVPAQSASSAKGLIVITQDGTGRAGWHFFKTSIKGSMGSLDVEKFLEIPLSVSIESSTAIPNARYDWYAPRAYSAT